MQQKFTQEADFRQERDFGQKISAAFEFVGAHWRPLGKCLAYFVLPAGLLMGLAMGIAQSQLFNNIGAGRTSSVEFLSNYVGPANFLGLASSLIGYTLLSATVYGYIRARMEHPAHELITPRVVGQYIARHAPRLILSSFLLGLIVVIGFMIFFIPGLYLMVALSLVWAVQVLEDGGIGYSLRRSMNLISGHWWATLGLLFIMSIIIGLMSVVFQIPQYLAIFGKTMNWTFLSSDIVMIMSAILTAVGGMILYVPLFLALAFQYFNLVEKKDGLGLRHMIDTLGSTATPVAQNANFRPDDDGEY